MLQEKQIGSRTIALPRVPDIAGLKFRKFQGESDFPVMLAIIHGSEEADRDEPTSTLEDIQRDYTHLVNCNPYQDMIMAEVNGKVIGYGRVFWMELGDGDRIYGHFVHLLPAWRKYGIRQTMLQYNELRAREIAAGHPKTNARWFEAWASEHEHDWREVLLTADYRPVRYGYQMVRPDLENIPDLPLPAGLEVRPVGPEQYRQVWEAAQEAFRDHWGYSDDEWADENYTSWMEWPDFEPRLWQVAWDKDEVAGMILNFINRNENQQYQRLRGYTETICVRRPWRRLGLARALIARSLRLLKDEGMAEACLGVDAQNPNGARHLYESMGFQTTKEYTTYRKLMENLS
ncbi:MAG: GNAT family N-acetyltransferase [Anaerolineae bacterium]|nr:GNAT family N-acetyltransferase [Anaerolineae bacterium]